MEKIRVFPGRGPANRLTLHDVSRRESLLCASKRKSSLRGLSLFLFGLVVGGAGLGSVQSLQAARSQRMVNKSRVAVESSVAEASDQEVDQAECESTLGKLDVFVRAMSLLEQHYVRPLNSDELVAAAIEGMTRRLDPHTSYLSARAAKMLNEEINGAFGGVGMVVLWDRQWLDEHGRVLEGDALADPNQRISRRISLKVDSVVAGSPAQKAGLRPGDRIVEIEGQSVSQFSSIGAAVMKMRGPVGESVAFRYRRDGIAHDLRVKRALVQTPPLKVKTLGDQIAHIEFSGFQHGSAVALRDAIKKLERAQQIQRGLILDLRDNGGGLLDEAVQVADLFIGRGPIVRTRGRGNEVLEQWRAHRSGTLNKLKVVVLVNKATASASEIVAGALQDHKRALIIGERSFGKGSVQVPFDLGDGSLLKTTIALYYTPQDRMIQATGIEPDLWVSPKAAEFEDSRAGLLSERDAPLHLRPEDFGRKKALSAKVEAPAKLPAAKASMMAAGEDAQLRAAVDYLWAADLL